MDVIPVTAAGLSHELLMLLRERIAAKFYEDPRVIDEIARAIVSLPVHFM